MSRSLFERLRREGGTSSRPARSRSFDIAEQCDSIRVSLERLLNSRQGMSLACPSYGLPELGELVLNVPERSREVESVIARCIAEFEPRLTDVEVAYLEDPQHPLVARFRINGRCVSGKRDDEVRFETMVASSGRLQLKSR
jgi:type VI secretion system protein